jgi:hypothetical protein
MGTIITNLKARFGVDSADFKKGLKDGEKAVDDFKDGAGNALDKFASMFGVNMSAVNDALGTATKSLNFLGQSITGLGTASNKAAVAFKLMKTVLISTGIGALVVALGSLVAYFQKSGEGADKFARILAQVKSVVNNVIDRLAIFGKGIFEIATGKFKQGWETMRTAFKDIGTEIKEDWKASGQLADAWDALEDREIALINSLEERKAKAAELRLLAKEETEDQKKKLSLIQQAESIIKSVYADEVSLAQERFNLTKKQIALAASDPTDEQRRQLAELEAEINSLLRQQSEELKSINREKRTALSIVNEETALEKVKAAQTAITKASLENISMPNFGGVVSQALAPFLQVKEQIDGIMIDVSDTIETALESMAVNVGEFLGALIIGDGSVKNFAATIASAFAELAITIGKVAIAAAITVGVIDKMLKNPANWPLALAAGIALVAVGTAIKGALANAAGGGGGSASAISSAGTVGSAQAVTTQQQNVTISLTGKLVAEGKDLVYVVDQENTRKKVST